MAVNDSVFEGEVNNLILFLDVENKILVSADHVWQPHVRAAVQRIKTQHSDRDITEERVSMEAISERRAQGVGDGLMDGKTATDMQREALNLFLDAVTEKASDIHIRVNKERCTTLFRVNNDLTLVRQEPSAWGAALCSAIYHSLADVSDATFEPGNRQDARIASRKALPEGLDGIRVATTPQVDGYVMVLRLLYDASGASTNLSDLGFSEAQTARVQILKRRPTGINIVSGPTGSGKSTTLQRILIKLIQETNGRKHVITVEDPPEYPIPGAVQTPVTNAQTEERRAAEFQKAIKGAMRVDPDIMMIGEMRDAPSARLAIQAALTGHQVWATLHANGAFFIPERLLDLGVPKDLIMEPSVVSGLMGQRLLKVLCNSCKVPMRDAFAKYRERGQEVEMNDLERVVAVLGSQEGVFVTGDGCAACRKTGSAGRSVVAEVVATDYTIMGLIRQGKTNEAIEYWRREHHGMTLRDHALVKVRSGTVDPLSAEAIVGDLASETGVGARALPAPRGETPEPLVLGDVAHGGLTQ
jgi:type II secretory ATPase GspE/PulE/Tfp pilus assembly ATPase PilB-like protein